MSPFDRAILAERTMAVERHLRRVAERLPVSAAEMTPATDASDAVVLHLWQATQIVIDQAMAACLALKTQDSRLTIPTSREASARAVSRTIWAFVCRGDQPSASPSSTEETAPYRWRKRLRTCWL